MWIAHSVRYQDMSRQQTSSIFPWSRCNGRCGVSQSKTIFTGGCITVGQASFRLHGHFLPSRTLGVRGKNRHRYRALLSPLSPPPNTEVSVAPTKNTKYRKTPQPSRSVATPPTYRGKAQNHIWAGKPKPLSCNSPVMHVAATSHMARKRPTTNYL